MAETQAGAADAAFPALFHYGDELHESLHYAGMTRGSTTVKMDPRPS